MALLRMFLLEVLRHTSLYTQVC